MTYLVIQICADEKCPGNAQFKNAIKASSLQDAKDIKNSLEKKPEQIDSCTYCNMKLIPTVAVSG
ncbi:hypothetical protein [Desulfolucanica intricata]|uniref:hypothetical protein n=1 Tax=Desulfolucanica intricata TaxID=1285191 RepID=UPI00083313DD|nr:hypothetical protein [Desulfolucanica intricata]